MTSSATSYIDYLRMTVVHGGGITHAQKDRRLRRPLPASAPATTAPADLIAHHHGRRTSTSASPSTTSASRSTCTTPPLTDEVFPHALHLRSRLPCTPATPPASASTSTRRSPQSTPTSVPTCPSPASSTAHSPTGKPTYGSFCTAVPVGSFSSNWSLSSVVFTVSLVMVSFRRSWSSGRSIVITDGNSWSPNFWYSS